MRATPQSTELAGIVQREGVMNQLISRRAAVRRMVAFAAVGLAAPALSACRQDPGIEAEDAVSTMAAPPGAADSARLAQWVDTLRREGLADSGRPLGLAAVRVGELAQGTPYEAYTLEEYLKAGGSPSRTEPLTLSLTKFDCVSLVEACLAVARVARAEGDPGWDAFGREMEKMRYRAGLREGYVSRLHYFSEWISDGAERGLVRPLGEELGGMPDDRPLRFMSSNPDSYPAMATPEVAKGIAEMERALDFSPRWVIPTADIPGIADSLESGDVLAFATSIAGLDVTHSAFAYRSPDGVMRVLHAPLSGGVVEITGTTVHEYVTAIRTATGILVARPLPEAVA